MTVTCKGPQSPATRPEIIAFFAPHSLKLLRAANLHSLRLSPDDVRQTRNHRRRPIIRETDSHRSSWREAARLTPSSASATARSWIAPRPLASRGPSRGREHAMKTWPENHYPIGEVRLAEDVATRRFILVVERDYLIQFIGYILRLAWYSSRKGQIS